MESTLSNSTAGVAVTLTELSNPTILPDTTTTKIVIQTEIADISTGDDVLFGSDVEEELDPQEEDDDDRQEEDDDDRQEEDDDDRQEEDDDDRQEEDEEEEEEEVSKHPSEILEESARIKSSTTTSTDLVIRNNNTDKSLTLITPLEQDMLEVKYMYAKLDTNFEKIEKAVSASNKCISLLSKTFNKHVTASVELIRKDIKQDITDQVDKMKSELLAALQKTSPPATATTTTTNQKTVDHCSIMDQSMTLLRIIKDEELFLEVLPAEDNTDGYMCVYTPFIRLCFSHLIQKQRPIDFPDTDLSMKLQLNKDTDHLEQRVEVNKLIDDAKLSALLVNLGFVALPRRTPEYNAVKVHFLRYMCRNAQPDRNVYPSSIIPENIMYEKDGMEVVDQAVLKDCRFTIPAGDVYRISLKKWNAIDWSGAIKNWWGLLLTREFEGETELDITMDDPKNPGERMVVKKMFKTTWKTECLIAEFKRRKRNQEIRDNRKKTTTKKSASSRKKSKSTTTAEKSSKSKRKSSTPTKSKKRKHQEIEQIEEESESDDAGYDDDGEQLSSNNIQPPPNYGSGTKTIAGHAASIAAKIADTEAAIAAAKVASKPSHKMAGSAGGKGDTPVRKLVKPKNPPPSKKTRIGEGAED